MICFQPMENKIEQYNILFHRKAKAVFFSVYEEFKHTTASLDRQRDENVFQRMQAQYSARLKRQLGEVALETLEQLSLGLSRDGFNRILTSFIEEYTTEFVQKARSL
jgi:hypothetical protein